MRCTFITDKIERCDNPALNSNTDGYCNKHRRMANTAPRFWANQQRERQRKLQQKESPMSRNTVKINGRTVTRAQVEQALKDLNTPILVAGDIVTADHDSKRYLVIGGSYGYHPLQDILDKEYEPLDGEIRITDGVTTWSWNESVLTKVGSLQDAK